MTQASGRFSVIPAWAVDDPRLGGASLRVLLAIGTYSDIDGWSFPSLSTIASRLAITRQAVQQSIRKLENFGYIEIEQRKRPNGSTGTNLYRILMDKPVRMMQGELAGGGKVSLPPKVQGNSLAPITSHSNLPTENDPSTPTKNGSIAIDRFALEFWPIYPRKVAKPAAIKAWHKLNPSPELTGEIVAAVKRVATTEQWRKEGGKFIPHPATYLNGRRWEDEAGGQSAGAKTATASWGDYDPEEMTEYGRRGDLIDGQYPKMVW